MFFEHFFIWRLLASDSCYQEEEDKFGFPLAHQTFLIDHFKCSRPRPSPRALRGLSDFMWCSLTASLFLTLVFLCWHLLYNSVNAQTPTCQLRGEPKGCVFNLWQKKLVHATFLISPNWKMVWRCIPSWGARPPCQSHVTSLEKASPLIGISRPHCLSLTVPPPALWACIP